MLVALGEQLRRTASTVKSLDSGSTPSVATAGLVERVAHHVHREPLAGGRLGRGRAGGVAEPTRSAMRRLARADRGRRHGVVPAQPSGPGEVADLVQRLGAAPSAGAVATSSHLPRRCDVGHDAADAVASGGGRERLERADAPTSPRSTAPARSVGSPRRPRAPRPREARACAVHRGRTGRETVRRRRGVDRLARMLLRMSHLFLRTLREDPADAEVPSHRLLVRAGYIRRAAPGIYSWLPLGCGCYRNVERIVREEMDAAGFQEVHFPALLPREPYEATGRWTEYGDNLFRLQGPQGRRLPARRRRTRSCSPCWSRTCTPRTRTCRWRSTRSRPSTATRRVPAPACCAAASS